MENMEYLLYPKSIAILGASTNLQKFSGRPLKFLSKYGYAGGIFPINPKPEVKEILGVKCYHSLKEIEDPIDQLIIALPAKWVVPAMEESASLKVRSIVLFSSGFAEAGEKGREMQERIADIARSAGMALCGPNCQGLINLNDHVISSFSNVLELDTLLKGNVGFISQSGALAGSILSLAQKQGVGFSHWISTGNEAVLGVADFVKYLAKDSATDVIAAYVEGIKDPDKWREACAFAARAEKPVVMMKTGKSDAGGKAISSHTGSVAGEDFIVDSFLDQNGILRVNDIGDMFDAMMILSAGKSPGKGRIGILTSSGGAGIIVADACSDCGIDVATLSEETRESLKKRLPRFASVQNPVDVTAQLFQMVFTGEPDLFEKCMEDLLTDESVDILVIALTMLIGDRAVKIAKDIVEVSKNYPKPVGVIWLAGDMAKEGYEILRQENIPLYGSATGCINAMQNLITFHKNIRKLNLLKDGINQERQVKTPLSVLEKSRTVLGKANRYMSGQRGRKLLKLYGIAMTAGELAHTEVEAVNIANKLTYPLAVKIDSPDIIHKTEAGGVLLDVQDEEQLTAAYRRVLRHAKTFLPNVRINGVLIEGMIHKGEGIEVIAGMKNDPIFGPVIVLGIGGIFVEVFQEVVCKIAPLTEQDAADMVKQLKGYPILEGVRGKPRLSISGLERALLDLSRLSVDFQDQIDEIDINPLIVLEEDRGVVAADVLILKKETGQ